MYVEIIIDRVEFSKIQRFLDRDRFQIATPSFFFDKSTGGERIPHLDDILMIGS
jgi:hypothetical protein